MEFILELIFEGAYALTDSKRVPLWIRIVLGTILLLFFGGTTMLLLIVGGSLSLENDAKGTLLLVLGVGLFIYLVYVLYHFYKKHHENV